VGIAEGDPAGRSEIEVHPEKSATFRPDEADLPAEEEPSMNG
jgi:hypothetical protein